jgi:hypothetical protein
MANFVQACFPEMAIFVAEKLLLRFPHFRHPWRPQACFPKMAIHVQAYLP